MRRQKTDLSTITSSDNPEPLRPREKAIYEAAARIFYQKGYAATTNQDVADAVGMLKGSLYYYIDTKEDLLYGVTMMGYAGMRHVLANSRELEGDILERLRFFIVQHTLAVIENLIPVAVVERDLRSLSEPRRQEIVEARDQYEAFLRELLTEGKKSGLIRPDVDVRLESILIFNQMHALYAWYEPKGRLSPSQIADRLADFVLHGVVAR